jgi:hypothetical protein
MLDMSMLSNECSKEEARSLLSAAILKQLEKTAGKDTQMYETALFRASALLINFQGIFCISVFISRLFFPMKCRGWILFKFGGGGLERGFCLWSEMRSSPYAGCICVLSLRQLRH